MTTIKNVGIPTFAPALPAEVTDAVSAVATAVTTYNTKRATLIASADPFPGSAAYNDVKTAAEAVENAITANRTALLTAAQTKRDEARAARADALAALQPAEERYVGLFYAARALDNS